VLVLGIFILSSSQEHWAAAHSLPRHDKLAAQKLMVRLHRDLNPSRTCVLIINHGHSIGSSLVLYRRFRHIPRLELESSFPGSPFYAGWMMSALARFRWGPDNESAFRL